MKTAGQSHADDVERGRELYARRAWNDAYEKFSRAHEVVPLEADDLEQLAWAAGLTARDDELLALLERLYQVRLDSGDGLGAGRAAFWIGFRLLNVGQMGRAHGWLARAQRIIEGAGSECALRGYLLLPTIYRNLMSGEIEAARADAAQALEIAERCGERDLVAFVRALQGRILLKQGRLEDGLGLLDEAMVAVTADELSPVMTGLIYCGVISCCQQVYALNRAREWTSALTDWCRAQPQLVNFTGSCLVHRSEIMQLGGDWPAAMEEARLASERLTRSIDKEGASHAFYQQAEIHRLRGEFNAAEEAYRRASQLGREPQPGLALLRLAQQRSDVAKSAIRRMIEITTDRLQRAGLLPAYVEIMLALGALDEARVACHELEEIATSTGSEVLGAIAAHARGAVLLAEGNAASAVEPLRRAFQVWQQIDAPYIAARIRVLLASAYRALADADATELELEAAREVFERLGAAPDLARLPAVTEKAATSRPHGLTPRELEVLRLVASGKTNKAIAKELFLSEKTVDRHVSNIFTKLDVPSRAAATAYAYEHGLI
jgi:DNA-binding NarL/FixJ family response regulator